MREWIEDKTGADWFATPLALLIWCLIFGPIIYGAHLANAETETEIVTLKPGQEKIVVTVSHKHVQDSIREVVAAECNGRKIDYTIWHFGEFYELITCDTVIVKAVGDSFLGQVAEEAIGESDLAPRYDCKRTSYMDPAQLWFCTHPECAPIGVRAILNDPRMSDIMDNINEELDKLVPRYECKKPTSGDTPSGGFWVRGKRPPCSHPECAPEPEITKIHPMPSPCYFTRLGRLVIDGVVQPQRKCCGGK